MLAAVFLPTRVGVGHAIGVSDVVLIEADRIHALGKKAAAVGIDQPEHAVALVNAKKAASAETVIGDSTPFGSLQAIPRRQNNNRLIYRIGRSELLIYLKIICALGRTISIVPRTPACGGRIEQ